jgi:hypothetical protein
MVDEVGQQHPSLQLFGVCVGDLDREAEDARRVYRVR